MKNSGEQFAGKNYAQIAANERERITVGIRLPEKPDTVFLRYLYSLLRSI